MADRVPGVFGFDPPLAGEREDQFDKLPARGAPEPAPSGFDAPTPMTDRIIAKVDDDWHPPAPDTSAWVEIDAPTLEDVGDVLKKLDEWGKGGGSLRAKAIPVGTSTNLTVTLEGHLIMRLPKWLNYKSASTAARKEWDRMFAKLKAHEQRHMDIAIEEGDKLAADLIGKDISKIASMVTAANAVIEKRQKKLDADTNHGEKKGVPYGDVDLDTSIP